jgi:hypothetical protein
MERKHVNMRERQGEREGGGGRTRERVWERQTDRGKGVTSRRERDSGRGGQVEEGNHHHPW